MPAKSSTERVRAYRDRQRKRGMRLIQMWVPDLNSPEFAAEAHRQSLRAAEGDRTTDDQDFIESVVDEDGW